MVDQLPNLGREQEMLAVMGLTSMDDLFSDIPEDVRRTISPLDLPPPQTEEEIWKDATRLLGANVPINSRPSFIGAGLYANHVPAMVPMLATRGEFLHHILHINLKLVKECYKQCGNSKPWYQN